MSSNEILSYLVEKYSVSVKAEMKMVILRKSDTKQRVLFPVFVYSDRKKWSV